MERVCSLHGLVKHNKRTDGGYRCSKCASAAVSKRRRAIKEQAIDYMGGACNHCKGSFHPAVYEFHHLDPGQKDFGISLSGATRSWEATRVELDKCVMLCANCHRIVHAADW